MLEDVALLWGTGKLEWERYRQFHGPPLRQVRAFWDPIAVAYRAADLVVARAGAMTTAELCAYGLPSILVPLKTAAADHQTKNALALEACGAARHLPEDRLSAAGLRSSIETILGDPELARRMQSAALSRARPDAARNIARAIIDLLS
jgi:UDP-N-acetylglucosamine--N-acetylmuramyl-(pentapeptide) pyrophosphoryl-undecaprenol N-acetylglucosamine transferase